MRHEACPKPVDPCPNPYHMYMSVGTSTWLISDKCATQKRCDTPRWDTTPRNVALEEEGEQEDPKMAATLAGILSASAKLLSRGFSAWLSPWHQVPHANPFGLIDCSCALWAEPKRDLSHTWGAAARVKVVRLFGVPTCWRSPTTIIYHSLIN